MHDKIGEVENRLVLKGQIDILKAIYECDMDIRKVIENLEKRYDQLALKKFKFYKLLHKPSGLFYTPSRTINVKLVNGDVARTKSNLAEKGKVYTIKPTGVLSNMGSFFNHTLLQTRFYPKPKTQTFYSRSSLERFCTELTKDEDWEIIGYE